jgi:hypothetical protein
MGFTRREVWAVLDEIHRTPPPTPEWIGLNTPLFLAAIGNYYSPETVFNEEQRNSLTAILLTFSRADPSTVARAVREWLHVNPLDAAARNRQLAEVLFTHPSVSACVDQPVLEAIADALLEGQSGAWRFARFFPQGCAEADDFARVRGQVGFAITEACSGSVVERRVDGLLRVLECTMTVFRQSPQLATPTREGRMEFVLGPTIRSVVNLVLRAVPHAQSTDDVAEGWFLRLWAVLRSGGWVELFREDVTSLAAMCPTPGAAARTAALLAAETPTLRANARVRMLRFELARRLNAADDMRALLTRDASWQACRLVLDAYLSQHREAEAISFAEQLPRSAERDFFLSRQLATTRPNEALELTTITPTNVVEVAKRLGKPIDEVIEHGLSKARDHGPWFRSFINLRDWDHAKALAPKTHPSVLLEALNAPEIPGALAAKLSMTALEGVLKDSTVWMDDATARQTTRAAFDAALRLTELKKRPAFLAKTRTRVDKAIGKLGFVRTLAFILDDALKEHEPTTTP